MKRARKTKGDGAARSSRTRPKAKKPRRSARLRKVLALFPQPELARICGVKRQAVQQWADLPPQHALAVEKASGGELTKEFLAPNFYPRPA